MAAARDQAARILRPEPDAAEGETARDASAGLTDQLRAHVSEETARRPAEADRPAIDKPAAAPTASANSAAPNSGKRKIVVMVIGALLALAAASYSGHNVLVVRVSESPDDA